MRTDTPPLVPHSRDGQLRSLRPRAGFYNGKPTNACKRGYALIDPNNHVIGGPYTTTAWANAAKRLIAVNATIELVEVIH